VFGRALHSPRKLRGELYSLDCETLSEYCRVSRYTLYKGGRLELDSPPNTKRVCTVVVLRVPNFRDFSSPNLLILFGKTRLVSDSSPGPRVPNVN
jgi:hypothetical protein